jgi:hypothetical protein
MSRQITGGNFQDSAGNLLDGGYMTFRLNTDVKVTGSNIQIQAGRIVTVPLGSGGSISGTVFLWPNSLLSPASVYIVKVYDANGVLAWNNQMTIPAGSGAFDIGTWIPSNL